MNIDEWAAQAEFQKVVNALGIAIAPAALLRDRDERYVMAIEQLHELGEVSQRAGQPVDLVNDDHIDLSGFHVG